MCSSKLTLVLNGVFFKTIRFKANLLNREKEEDNMLTFEKDTKYALFEGIEQEGYFKGRETLFVMGCAPTEMVLQEYSKLIERTQMVNIYFGAGGSFYYSKATVGSFQKKYPGRIIYIESPEIDLDLMSEYKEIRWMLPLIFRGEVKVDLEIRDMLGKMIEERKAEEQSLVDRIELKFDWGERVLVVPLRGAVFSKYEEYIGDLLIIDEKYNKA
jgi:hypothetical protein